MICQELSKCKFKVKIKNDFKKSATRSMTVKFRWLLSNDSVQQRQDSKP